MMMSCKLELTEMYLASNKTVLESMTSHEQSAAYMARRRIMSSVERTLNCHLVSYRVVRRYQWLK